MRMDYKNLQELTRIASELDSRGLVKEADQIDKIIKEAEPISLTAWLLGAGAVALAGWIAKMSDDCVDILDAAGINYNDFDPNDIDEDWVKLMNHLEVQDLWDGPTNWPGGSPGQAKLLSGRLTREHWKQDVYSWYSGSEWADLEDEVSKIDNSNGECPTCGDWSGKIIWESKLEEIMQAAAGDWPVLGWDEEGAWAEAINTLIVGKRFAVQDKVKEWVVAGRCEGFENGACPEIEPVTTGQPSSPDDDGSDGSDGSSDTGGGWYD